MSFYFLQSDSDYIKLLPLFVKLMKDTKAPIGTSLQELSNPNALILIEQVGGEIIGYLCGHPINADDFYICQACNDHSKDGQAFFDAYEKALADRGYKRVYAHTIHDPRIFRRYGFSFDRSLIKKELNHEQSD